MFDSPHVKVPIGKQTRRRLDAKSIVQLLQSFDAPVGILYNLCHYLALNRFVFTLAHMYSSLHAILLLIK